MDDLNKVESRIEEIFYLNLVKYINEETVVHPQEIKHTRHGTFRLDFAIDSSLRVAFECDGRDFHDEFRDEMRDAILLGERHIDVIYRLPGSAIFNATADLLFLIMKWDSWMFSERGRVNLNTLASDYLIDEPFDQKDESSDLIFGAMGRSATIIRRTREPRPGQRSHWIAMYKWTSAQPSIPFDRLVQRRLDEIHPKCSRMQSHIRSIKS